jgi:hypothetical protein
MTTHIWCYVRSATVQSWLRSASDARGSMWEAKATKSPHGGLLSSQRLTSS